MCRMRSRLAVTAALPLVFLAVTARSQEVSYTVSIPQPTTRLVHVTIAVTDAPGDSFDVALPMWTPGGYGMSWFAKNVREVYAVNDDGRRLGARQVDTSQWRIDNDDGTVRVHYQVYIPARRNVALLNDVHLRLSGPQTLMYVVGTPPYPVPGPVTLEMDTPEGWVFATGLDEAAPGRFSAPDYDTLIDAPVEAAVGLDKWSFEDHGAVYEIAIRNEHNYDRDALTDDIRRVVAELTEMMGEPPFERYVFLLTGLNRRGGGLEHLNSTTITFKRYDEMSSSDYHRFKALVAHEFFHLWNVKRIRPEILGPFDYSKPQPTRNLYVSEGITDYYGDLAVARAALWSHEELYESIAEMIATLQSNPGRLITSAESSSFRAWTPSDIPAHTEISYYVKGYLIGLLLDMDIRSRTQNRRSLDDVMRYLLAEHGLPKPGFEEERGFRDAVETIVSESGGGGDFGAFFNDYVAGVEELDYGAYLSHVGLRLHTAEKDGHASLELETRMNGDLMSVSALTYDGAAYRAGMMTGDILVLLNGERVVPTTLASRLKMIGVGGVARLEVLRDNRLIPVNVPLAEDRPVTYEIVEDDQATPEQVSARQAWLRAYAR